MNRLHQALLGIFFLLATQSCFANLIITGTRVIYPSNAKTITVKMANEGSLPSLAQSWIDSGDANANPATAKSPFLIIPPIVRVEQDQGQELKITYNGERLPDNKESIFWLNVLDIPPKQISSTGNQLALAIRSRLKLFFRPDSIGNPSDKDYKNLIFSVLGGSVKIENKSPYYITIAALDVSGVKSFDPIMVAPFSTQVEKSSRQLMSSGKITYSIIDDYGAARNYNYQY